MKQALLIFTILITLTSCNKDDNPTKTADKASEHKKNKHKY